MADMLQEIHTAQDQDSMSTATYLENVKKNKKTSSLLEVLFLFTFICLKCCEDFKVYRSSTHCCRTEILVHMAHKQIH